MGNGSTRKFKTSNKRAKEQNNRYKKSRNRRALRKAERGREFENTTMVKLLEKMVEDKKINNFTYHKPHSSADCAGKDFTVRMIVNEKMIEHSFGVTTSLRSWKNSEVKHPKVVQFCFPTNTRSETIQKRVLGLFKS